MLGRHATSRIAAPLMDFASGTNAGIGVSYQQRRFIALTAIIHRLLHPWPRFCIASSGTAREI